VQENKLFEVLLDVIPFAAYAVDIETYEVVYANKLMSESMYAPREEHPKKSIAGKKFLVKKTCVVGAVSQH